jgi:cytochrome P450
MYLDLHQGLSTANRHDYYQHLHRHGTVLRGSAPMPEFDECWYVIGYADALAVLRSDLFIHDRSTIYGTTPLSSFSGAARQFWESLTEWPLFTDPPQHTEKRLALSHLFREQSIQPLEQLIEQECNNLLDWALSQAEFDLMLDFAYPLTLRIICKVIGITPPATGWFKRLANEMANAMDFHASPYDYRPALQALDDLRNYLSEEIKQARKDSLPSRLAASGMPEKDKINFLTQLVFAGQETSADAIGNLILVMHQRRELWQLVQADHHLAGSVCKESLRYNSSLQFTGIRTAAKDITLGDTAFKRGDSVVIATAACNLDPRHFGQPLDFNPLRETSGPELTFGHGIHYCLGVHLARMELQIALKALVNRLPESWRIEEVRMRQSLVFHGPAKLRISTS